MKTGCLLNRFLSLKKIEITSSTTTFQSLDSFKVAVCIFLKVNLGITPLPSHFKGQPLIEIRLFGQMTQLDFLQIGTNGCTATNCP